MPGFPFSKREEYLVKMDFFPPRILWNKTSALQLSIQIQSGWRSSSQKPISHLGFTSTPQVSTAHLLAALQTSSSIGGETRRPSPFPGCLPRHAAVSVRSVVWQHLHSISAARASAPIAPAAAALQTRRCFGLCWGRSNNALLSTPASCSWPLQICFYSFSVAEPFLSRKIWQKLVFPLQNNSFK